MTLSSGVELAKVVLTEALLLERLELEGEFSQARAFLYFIELFKHHSRPSLTKQMFRAF